MSETKRGPSGRTVGIDGIEFHARADCPLPYKSPCPHCVDKPSAVVDLHILDRTTGEIIVPHDCNAVLAGAGIVDLRLAEMNQLAGFIESVRVFKSIATEAAGEAGDELIRRMDRDGKWTWRDDCYEAKSASPEAGTTVYDTTRLHEALVTLLAADVVSVDGARAALEPIYPTAPVPYELLWRVRAGLEGELADDVYDRTLREVEALMLGEPEVTYKQHANGIKALLKIPAAREPIEACRELVDRPRRTAKVKWIA